MARHLTVKTPLFEALIGTGGIGSGTFFALNGNTTLGREESRGGVYLNRRDYCKLHIVSHYMQLLMGPDFAVLPIGKVGDDENGHRLLAEMTATGMRMKYVQTLPSAPTLFSFCFVYPDGTGGNLTTDNSACAAVDAESIQAAEADFANYAEDAIALAMPEVPLAARAALLEMATKYGCFRVASFTTSEIVDAMNGGLLRQVDLLAINLDEAIAVVGGDPRGKDGHDIAKAAVWKLRHMNRKLCVAITGGRMGGWVWDGRELVYECAWSVQPASTAGAGDAFLAGMLCALSAQLELDMALRFGNLVAACSVQSPHTIHPDLSRDSLAQLAGSATRSLDSDIWQLLAGTSADPKVTP